MRTDSQYTEKLAPLPRFDKKLGFACPVDPKSPGPRQRFWTQRNVGAPGGMTDCPKCFHDHRLLDQCPFRWQPRPSFWFSWWYLGNQFSLCQILTITVTKQNANAAKDPNESHEGSNPLAAGTRACGNGWAHLSSFHHKLASGQPERIILYRWYESAWVGIKLHLVTSDGITAFQIKFAPKKPKANQNHILGTRGLANVTRIPRHGRQEEGSFKQWDWFENLRAWLIVRSRLWSHITTEMSNRVGD